MKSLFLSLSLLFVQLTIQAQTSTSEVIIDDNQSISKVYNNNNEVAKKFSNAKEWIAKTYGNYQSVLQFEDNENYKIIIKSIQPFKEEKAETSHPSGRVYIFTNASLCYTLTIDCKSDKYRIKMENININEHVKTNIVMLSDLRNEKFTKTVEEFTDPSPFIKALEADEKLLTELLEVDTSKLKKKYMREEHERTINLTNIKIDYDKQQIKNMDERKNIIYSFISDLYNSLSKAIEYNDDF